MLILFLYAISDLKHLKFLPLDAKYNFPELKKIKRRYLL